MCTNEKLTFGRNTEKCNWPDLIQYNCEWLCRNEKLISGKSVEKYKRLGLIDAIYIIVNQKWKIGRNAWKKNKNVYLINFDESNIII